MKRRSPARRSSNDSRWRPIPTFANSLVSPARFLWRTNLFLPDVKRRDQRFVQFLDGAGAPAKLESASSVGLKGSSYLGSVSDWVTGISSKDTDQTAEVRQGLARGQSSLSESKLL